MKITDINVAIDARRPSDQKRVSADMVYDYMERYRIDHVVAYHNHALSNPLAGNQLMIDVAEKSTGRIGACLVLNPLLIEESVPGIGTLAERLASIRPEAVRMCPDEYEIPFHLFYWRRLLDALNDTKLPILIDCATTPLFFTMLPDILAAYPGLNFVILRCGFRKQYYIAPLLRSFNNLYMDASILIDAWQIEEVFDIDECSHLLFGSQFPKYVPTGQLGLVAYAEIPDSRKECIFNMTWEALKHR